MARFIHQRSDWPDFRWNSEVLLPSLGRVRHLQGLLIGRMEATGLELRNEANLESLSTEVVKSAEIEGEVFAVDQVRSSVARRLGLELAGEVPTSREIDGMVELLLDALQNYAAPLTEDRLMAWHHAMFPTGRSGMYQIVVGDWRDDSTGPVQVVSGALGKARVHFEAPAAVIVPNEMLRFLAWMKNTQDMLDPIVKAGIAHLWFVTIHPFEDGNGRMARAITDLLLARADGVVQRYYSMSAQIRKERKQYYEMLERTQRGDLDITTWLCWFLDCLCRALEASKETLQKVFRKHQFWLRYADQPLNDRQRMMLNRLLDDFRGKLTTKKWSKMTKVSHDTALRDIQLLINRGILRKEAAGGRSTNYELNA